MLFINFCNLEDLTDGNGSYWGKFWELVKPGATTNSTTHGGSDGSVFWEGGKRILQNIQDRNTTQAKMKRPEDEIKACTKTPESTGARKKSNTDGDEQDFDIHINAFDIGDNNGNDLDDNLFKQYDQKQLRTHDALVHRGNILEKILSTPMVDPDSSLFVGMQQTETAGGSAPEDGDPNDGDSGNMHQPRDYATVLTFIEGSLLGGSPENGDRRDEGLNGHDSGSEEDRSDGVEDPRTLVQATHSSGQHNIPTLKQFADSSGKTMDDKQYIAYEVICCTFLLQLIYEGGTQTPTWVDICAQPCTALVLKEKSH